MLRLEERVAFSDARFHEAAGRASSLQKEVSKPEFACLSLRRILWTLCHHRAIFDKESLLTDK